MNRYLATALISAVLLSGCSPSETIDATPDAKKVVNAFFDGFKQKDFNSIYDLYGDDFWEATPREIWEKIIPNVHDELGAIQSCELQTWHQKTQVGTSGSGTYVILTYACQHTKYESVITFTTHKPLKGGETKIVTQSFNSLGLLIE